MDIKQIYYSIQKQQAESQETIHGLVKQNIQLPKIKEASLKPNDTNFLKNNLIEYQSMHALRAQKYNIKKKKFTKVKAKYLQENKRENQFHF